MSAASAGAKQEWGAMKNALRKQIERKLKPVHKVGAKRSRRNIAGLKSRFQMLSDTMLMPMEG